MVPNILPLIPKHTVYVEPFAGGAAVFFAKPWPNTENSDHYREVLNDKDQRLINFYRVLQTPEKREALIERLSLTLYSEEEREAILRVFAANAPSCGPEVRNFLSFFSYSHAITGPSIRERIFHLRRVLSRNCSRQRNTGP